MPWQEVSTVSQREEFVKLASVAGTNVRALCREFGISPPTGYKWLARYREAGIGGLADRSRRPIDSPLRTAAEIETAVVELRAEHPAWGGRKLRARLQALGHTMLPSASTITAILRRYRLIDPAEGAKHRPFQRFERARPNELWQMDFKGPFVAVNGPFHALSILDDHSRFCVGLHACSNQETATVQACLSEVFREYGLPDRMLMDNGSPWGSDADHPYTPLTVWLLRLGVGFTHGHPYHPQTQGKVERFHLSLILELLAPKIFADRHDCQAGLDTWREVYNQQRPHEALDMQTPASRYRPSSRPFPERLPTIEYTAGEVVRKVQVGGDISFAGRAIHVGKAFRGYQVALRADVGSICHVLFGEHCIGQVDLSQTSRRSSDVLTMCPNKPSIMSPNNV